MKAAYGIETSDGNDSYITAAEEMMDGIAQAGSSMWL